MLSVHQDLGRVELKACEAWNIHEFHIESRLSHLHILPTNRCRPKPLFNFVEQLDELTSDFSIQRSSKFQFKTLEGCFN